MHLDPSTLRDLVVLSSSGIGGATVLSLVDHTRTRAGREQLRKSLTSPARTAEQILARQVAHQAIASNEQLRNALDRAGLDETERYLNSRWKPASSRTWLARFVEATWLRVKHQDFVQEIGVGRDHIAALLSAASAIAEQLLDTPSTLLNSIGADLQDRLSVSDMLELRASCTHRTVAAQLRCDQLARGKARSLVSELVELLGAVEAAWSLAFATVEHGWAYPTPGSEFCLKGLWHPFLGRRSIPNDLALTAVTRVCFLTGPNMAGKSTFLKAVAIAVLLAHTGCGVPAAAMEFRPVDTLFSSVQITDNLGGGESFYLAEVRRIKTLALALHHASGVAVLDEPFRGTNVHDAAEATLAVLTRLASHPTALIFIASHIGEVVPAICEDPRIRLLHFAAEVTTGEPRFDYRLRDGASTQRLGMTLLKREGVLELLGNG